jgi:hypothetical protein
MAARFTQAQFAMADQIAEDQFHDDLRAEMMVAFPHLDKTLVAQYCALCRATCARLGIQTEKAISCFFILSLHGERLLSETDGYADEHVRYVRKYGSGEQVPIDMHAWLTACAA